MDTRLHDFLDGNPPNEGDSGLFKLPEERLEFAEHRKLRDAMRHNADNGVLTSTEKATMRAELATAIKMAPATPSSTGITSNISGRSEWYKRGAVLFLLGVVIGAGLFMALDAPATVVQRQVGVPVQAALPSTVPYAMPEPSAAEYDSLLQLLRESASETQNEKALRGSSHKKKGRSELSHPDNPTTGTR